jgi:hypothetical protein
VSEQATEQDRVLAAVAADPGSTAAEVGQAVSPPLGRARALEALTALEGQHKVTRKTGQRRVGWYPEDGGGV